MPDLSRLARLLAEPRDELLKGLRWIGERYSQLSEDPEFFKTGRAPARGLQAITEKYQLPLVPSEDVIPYHRELSGPPYGGRGRRYFFTPQLGGEIEPRAYMDIRPGAEAYHHFPWPSTLPRAAADEMLTRREDPFGMLNTMYFTHTGGGKKTTPAMLDYAAERGATMVPDIHTAVNMWRAPLNEIGSLLRHGEGLKIWPHEKWVPRGFDPLQMAESPVEEQIGARLPVAVARSMGYFEKSPLRLARSRAQRGDELDLNILRDEGFIPSELKMGRLTAESDPIEFVNQARALRFAGAREFGESTLRKMALLQRFLDEYYGGHRATEINPDLLKGIEYAAGGRVNPSAAPR